MALVDALTTLAAVKLEAGISDTSHDTTLEALINSVSAAIRAHLGREISRTTHTAEPYHVNARQFLLIKEYPVQALTSVTINGQAQTIGTDVFMDSFDALVGRIYRPNGWFGTMYARGTFPEAFAGARDILVTYEAGYYLPNDTTTPPADPHYVAGAIDSLPLSISYACNRAVVSRYRTIMSNADGLESLSEGGISVTWFGPDSFLSGSGGFDKIVLSMLEPYRRREAIG